MSTIATVFARQILDSRGNPTVEADVHLENGVMGRAAVPSGASTGSNEAHELRDGDHDLYGGQSVLRAVANVNETIAPKLNGMDVHEQEDLDTAMVELDGTDNKEKLGANAILAVSLAAAKAAALTDNQQLFEYVGGISHVDRAPIMPVPMCNLINGGKHAAGSTDIQEFMVMPVGATDFPHAIQMTAEIFQALKQLLTQEDYSTTVGDEGGFAPAVQNGNREALELLTVATERAGYVVGEHVAFGIDAAATEFRTANDTYTLASEDRTLSTDDLISMYQELATAFPLISVEDGLAEDDWAGWQSMTERLGEDMQLVGDDFLVTNTQFLERAVAEKAGNAILIKVNQIGTLTETVQAVDMAHEAGWNAIISHRSGETEDTTIAHLAVGLGTGQIKAGSMSRTDRTAKYNELLRINETLGDRAQYAGGM